MKDLLLEHRLKRVTSGFADELIALTARYLRQQVSPETLTRLRWEVDAALKRTLIAARADHIPRFVLAELDDHRRLVLRVSIAAFDHDCDQCVYLGRHTGGDQRLLDLYTCDKAGYRTFVARYGDDGPQYTSAPAVTLEQTAYMPVQLYEARRRWELKS